MSEFGLQLTGHAALAYFLKIQTGSQLTETDEYGEAETAADDHLEGQPVNADNLLRWAEAFCEAFDEDKAQTEHNAHVDQWG